VKAIIFGATGATGQELAHVLCEDERYTDIYCPTRRPLNWQHQKLRVLDFNEGLDSLNIDCDVAYVCIGTTVKQAGSVEAFRKVDFDLVFDICKWAKKINVSELHLQSSIGADASSKMNYLKVKGELEEVVKKLDIKQLFIYRPALLCGAERADFRIGEELGYIILKVLPLIVPPLKKQQAVEVNAVARCMAEQKNPTKAIEIIESPLIAEFGMPPKRFLKENAFLSKLLVALFILTLFLSQSLKFDKSEQILSAFLAGLVIQAMILLYTKKALSNKEFVINKLEKSYLYLIALATADGIMAIYSLSFIKNLSLGSNLTLLTVLIGGLLIKVFQSQNIKATKKFFTI
jgi:uncharacterized protein YbjT (DUF2867 family)